MEYNKMQQREWNKFFEPDLSPLRMDFRTFAQAASVLNPWRNMPIILDVSKWQTDVDWKAAKADGVVGAIIRAGQGDYEIDPMLRDHVQNAYDANLPIGVYWVLDAWPYGANMGLKTEFWPKGDQDRTVKKMKEALAHKAYSFIALDLEIYHDSQGNVITEPWIATTFRYIYDQVCASFPGVPIVIYTAKWFVERYPSMTMWLDNVKELWLAQYPVYPPNVVNLQSLADWRRDWAPADTWTPALFGNISGALFWQVSGNRFTLPYHKGGSGLSSVDINVWPKGLQDWYDFCKFTPGGTPDPEVPPVVPPVVPPADTTLATILAELRALRARFEEVFK